MSLTQRRRTIDKPKLGIHGSFTKPQLRKAIARMYPNRTDAYIRTMTDVLWNENQPNQRGVK